MILGVGVDIVKIARFEEISPSFVRRVFAESECARLGITCGNAPEGTPDEITPSPAYILSPPAQATAAGLFAAKEAVAKALGTGFRTFSPCDIEILHDAHGAPRVRLHNAAKKLARRQARGRYRIHISISHTDTDVLAVAIIERHSRCSRVVI